MGCDIHAVFQTKQGGKWIDIPSKFEEDRHYFLFSWLADVRNGFGFAGVPTYKPIRPIDSPRGLPPDFQCDSDRHNTTTAKWGDDGEKFMGDHSHSWLTADEILAAERPRTTRVGVISLAAYRKWDGTSPPESWSGDITGPKIVVSDPPDITDKTTHVRITWESPADELDYFVNEIKRLRDQHGEVRMVFGFDS